MQCNVLCSLLYNQMNNSYLSKPPISLYLSSIANFLLVLDKLHCTWFRSMITMYLATRPKLDRNHRPNRKNWRKMPTMEVSYGRRLSTTPPNSRNHSSLGGPQIRSNKMCNKHLCSSSVDDEWDGMLLSPPSPFRSLVGRGPASLGMGEDCWGGGGEQ